MKLKIFLVIAICAGMILSSTAGKHKKVAKVAKAQKHIGNPKKIDGKGQFQPFYGYKIAAMIDTKLTAVAKEIEKFILKGSMKKSYAALPASSFHMTIYSIYQCGGELIPPVKRWAKASHSKISNRKWLPYNVLHEKNKKATCIIERYLNESLIIKYADLNIGKTTLSLSLELEEESLQRIRNVRKELANIYEHKDKSMEPINKKLQITLAYVYGSKKTVDIGAWNQLNLLTRSFNGAKLSFPSIYLFSSVKRFIPFQKKFDCTD